LTDVCVDASVALDLLVPSEATPAVDALWTRWLAEGTTIIVPPYFFVEVTSVLRNKVFLRRISPERGENAFREFLDMPIEPVEFAGIRERAWRLAVELGRPEAYDSQYLAVAEHRGCEFWTTDQRLYHAVGNTLSWVRIAS
jgi:predicted nucleic acid-binding protein